MEIHSFQDCLRTLAKQRCNEEVKKIKQQLQAARTEAQHAQQHCKEMERLLAMTQKEVIVLNSALEQSEPTTYWKILETEFGIVLEGLEGDTMLPPGMWEDMVTKLSANSEGKHGFLILNRVVYAEH